MSQDFYIYRPPLPSHRLENSFAKEEPGVWKPSHSYRHRLEDVQNQLTPAEHFRRRLATSGKQIRLIQRLELRINRNLEAFEAAAVKIQARARGNIGRRRFLQVKDDLKTSLELRRVTQHAIEAFKSRQYESAISFCRMATSRSVDSWMLQAKCHYQLGEYVEVIECTNAAHLIDSAVEELYYIQACAWCKLGEFSSAINALDAAYVSIAKTSSATVRLYGMICCKLSPPRFEGAIDSFSEVILRDPKDLDALLERASCYCCLQDFSQAFKDLNKVLAFKPDHLEARLRRARLHTCVRDWKAARVDFTMLLETSYAAMAAEGLQIIQPADNNALAHT